MTQTSAFQFVEDIDLAVIVGAMKLIYNGARTFSCNAIVCSFDNLHPEAWLADAYVKEYTATIKRLHCRLPDWWGGNDSDTFQHRAKRIHLLWDFGDHVVYRKRTYGLEVDESHITAMNSILNDTIAASS